MSDTQQGSVLILGVGSPRGLGAAAARVFAAEGFPVVIAGRNHDKLRQAAESVAAVGRAPRVHPKPFPRWPRRLFALAFLRCYSRGSIFRLFRVGWSGGSFGCLSRPRSGGPGLQSGAEDVGG